MIADYNYMQNCVLIPFFHNTYFNTCNSYHYSIDRYLLQYRIFYFNIQNFSTCNCVQIVLNSKMFCHLPTDRFSKDVK